MLNLDSPHGFVTSDGKEAKLIVRRLEGWSLVVFEIDNKVYLAAPDGYLTALGSSVVNKPGPKKYVNRPKKYVNRYESTVLRTDKGMSEDIGRRFCITQGLKYLGAFEV